LICRTQNETIGHPAKGGNADIADGTDLRGFIPVKNLPPRLELFNRNLQ